MPQSTLIVIFIHYCLSNTSILWDITFLKNYILKSVAYTTPVVLLATYLFFLAIGYLLIKLNTYIFSPY